MRAALAIIGAALLLSSGVANAVRVKDLGHFDGVRKNQLVGYGLVVGLDGTGDTEQASFAGQSVEAMLSRLGVRVDKRQMMLRNVAAVTVTADLPPFARPGTTIDVQVSSIGDARSLVGGMLLMSPLRGANGETYALAQGPVLVGSALDEVDGRRYRGRLNVGRVSGGALVEREVKVALGAGGVLRFVLTKPDFKTASNLAEAVSRALGAAPNVAGAARPVDGGAIDITVPPDWVDRIAAFIATLEGIEVAPDALARVVVSATTGAVVLGGEVRLSQVAIAYDGVSLEIGADPPRAPPTNTLQLIDQGATLADVVRGLNRLGVSARGLVDILQALAAAGALRAELEVIP